LIWEEELFWLCEISKIHEHDNTNLYKQFKDLIGEIYTEVHVRPRVVILVDDEGNEIICQKKKKYHLIFSVKGIIFVGL
jgi:N utilization substance protein A